MIEPIVAPQDLRIEIPWSGQDHSKTTAKSTRLLIVLSVALTGPFFVMLLIDDARRGLSSWFFLAYCVIFLPIIMLGYRSLLESRNDSRCQFVEARGGQLTIERQNVFREATEVFEILKMHDLRVLPWELGSEALGVPVMRYPYSGVGPERIAFTYAGTSHSFGGPAGDEFADDIVGRIAEYDRQLRVSLGMHEEPNITTCDPERIANCFSVRDGWDVDVSPTAL